jgi:resuscitation-promoting factor RpfB
MTDQQPRDPHLNAAYRRPDPARRPGVSPQAAGRPGRRAGLVVGGGLLAVVLLCCGGVTRIGGLGDRGKPKPAADGGQVAAAAPITVAPTTPTTPTTPATSAGTTPPATPAGTPTASPTPQVRTRTVTETATVPFTTRTVKDSSLLTGRRVVRARGVAGVRTLTWEITLTDGVPTGKRLVRSAVTRQPVVQVVAVGTKAKPKPASRCDPNYSGCVPIASDVDCAGGSGNGPAYVTGPVRVIGSDIYDLDRDGDGIGCDD